MASSSIPGVFPPVMIPLDDTGLSPIREMHVDGAVTAPFVSIPEGMFFWEAPDGRELKGRVADPDPQARAPLSGEERTSDGHIVIYQSRPLPDGATLVAFSDVTAIARTLPDAKCARKAVGVSTTTGNWPPSTSVIALPEPL